MCSCLLNNNKHFFDYTFSVNILQEDFHEINPFDQGNEHSLIYSDLFSS